MPENQEIFRDQLYKKVDDIVFYLGQKVPCCSESEPNCNILLDTTDIYRDEAISITRHLVITVVSKDVSVSSWNFTIYYADQLVADASSNREGLSFYTEDLPWNIRLYQLYILALEMKEKREAQKKKEELQKKEPKTYHVIFLANDKKEVDEIVRWSKQRSPAHRIENHFTCDGCKTEVYSTEYTSVCPNCQGNLWVDAEYENC